MAPGGVLGKKLSTFRSQFGPNFKFRSRQLLLSTKSLQNTIYGSFDTKYGVCVFGYKFPISRASLTFITLSTDPCIYDCQKYKGDNYIHYLVPTQRGVSINQWKHKECSLLIHARAKFDNNFVLTDQIKSQNITNSTYCIFLFFSHKTPPPHPQINSNHKTFANSTCCIILFFPETIFFFQKENSMFLYDECQGVA